MCKVSFLPFFILQLNILVSYLKKEMQAYWKQNLKYLIILLIVWFTVSFGAGILFVDQLNVIKIGGFKLGFWFAQQGSIYVFVVLIFVYVFLMNRLDDKNLN